MPLHPYHPVGLVLDDFAWTITNILGLNNGKKRGIDNDYSDLLFELFKYWGVEG